MTDKLVKLAELVRSTGPTVSFEFFPPRTPAAQKAFAADLRELLAVAPDFVSVTYGSNGATRDGSRELVSQLLNTGVRTIAHMTCVATPRDEVREVVERLLELGVRDILAIRGDPPRDGWAPGDDDLRYASDLVVLVRDIQAEVGADVSVAVAAYPGGQGGTFDIGPDVAALKAKKRAGADLAITQVFFDPKAYANLVNSSKEANITFPILPGILPLTDLDRVDRLSRLTGVPVPNALREKLTAAREAGEEYEVGMAATVDLAQAVLDEGAPGVHVYTFNKARAALELVQRLGLR
jgi:methylenetetrahydrofolate reductase (NADPH)